MNLEKSVKQFKNDFNPFHLLAELRAMDINREKAYRIANFYEKKIYNKVVKSVKRYY